MIKIEIDNINTQKLYRNKLEKMKLHVLMIVSNSLKRVFVWMMKLELEDRNWMISRERN
jgi:hypothetical protein